MTIHLQEMAESFLSCILSDLQAHLDVHVAVLLCRRVHSLDKSLAML